MKKMTLYNGYIDRVAIHAPFHSAKKHSEVLTGKQIYLLLFIGRKEDDSNSKSRRTKKH